MKIGIVFGCFIPLHKGHLFLINNAIKDNDKVIIGVCGKDNDRGKDFIPFKDRITLMQTKYPNHIVVPIDDNKLHLDGSFSMNNWILWGNELFTNANLNPNDNNIYTWYMGEPSYKEKLAQIYPNHKFKLYNRGNLGVSGTKIRENTMENIKYIDKDFINYLRDKQII
ncbi:MAG: adenylyltransferase/cytidyltransferase family protein [Bacilli bacterium]|nr:adenylyltransferase/cytidyltransferase family protein [Bacilli bacterium]